MSRVLWLKTFDDYIKCLLENIIVTREQRNIRSRHHHLHTEKEKKIASSAHGDKRCLQPGMTDTLPWGHYKIVGEAAANEEASREEGIEPPNTATSNEEASREEEGIEPPIAAAVSPLYKEAVREQELIRSVEPPTNTQPSEQQVVSLLTVTQQTFVHQDISLIAAQQPLLVAQQPLLKRSCETTLDKSVNEKPREI